MELEKVQQQYVDAEFDVLSIYEGFGTIREVLKTLEQI